MNKIYELFELTHKYKWNQVVIIISEILKSLILVVHFQGAQIFEAVGLSESVINKCFVGTASRIGGCTFDILGAEVCMQIIF